MARPKTYHINLTEDELKTIKSILRKKQTSTSQKRIETIELLRKELSSWEEERNKSKAKIKWHFQTGDAREKLISLYPSLILTIK